VDLTITPRVRVLALAGILATLAFAAGMFMLGRNQDDYAAEAALMPLPKRPVAKPAEPARPKAARPKPKPIKQAATPPRAAVEAAKRGLPSSIATVMGRSEVVVAALFSRSARVDELALREAQAGARDVGAGFVLVDVNDQGQTRPLAALLGVLQDPAVLVFRRPGELYLRINGFADRETVAQAAANAAS
jgi:hypothetical protein